MDDPLDVRGKAPTTEKDYGQHTATVDPYRGINLKIEVDDPKRDRLRIVVWADGDDEVDASRFVLTRDTAFVLLLALVGLLNWWDDWDKA